MSKYVMKQAMDALECAKEETVSEEIRYCYEHVIKSLQLAAGAAPARLTNSEKTKMWHNATINPHNPKNCYLRGMTDAESYYLAAGAAPVKSEPTWDEALRISELPDIDEAIRNLIEDGTENNAVCLIRMVIAAGAAPKDLK